MLYEVLRKLVELCDIGSRLADRKGCPRHNVATANLQLNWDTEIVLLWTRCPFHSAQPHLRLAIASLSDQMTAYAVSAPGKVLLAGGYLVLDREYTGFSFGLNARIHVHIEKLPTTEGVSLQEIIVRSPQFLNASWRYGYFQSHNKAGGVQLRELRTFHTAG